MTVYSSDIAFTPSVKKIQEDKGSRRGYAHMEDQGGWRTEIDEQLTGFIAERDSFYLGTATSDGQPYIQHRGGKPGFLKIIDDTTLAFADFRGNRQYISSGNLKDNEKAYIFLMDYANQRRVKIWGTAKTSSDPALMERLKDDDYKGVPEQAIIFEIKAWDTNCPQHITRRFTEPQINEMTENLRIRIYELEQELAALKQ